VAKIPGIGCSSKTPDYFLAIRTLQFGAWRMPSVLTGANRQPRLIYLGVSGDGDSASIGFGQFAHSIRRGVNMTYIVENTACTASQRASSRPPPTRGSRTSAGDEQRQTP